jgi:DNA invertase Pin-like site-specific DNA recombinase
MTGQRIGYKRVSSADQNTARQLEGIAVNKLFADHLSGKDRARPELRAALDFCREGDTLVVHSMDRLARNLVDLRQIVAELTSKGCAVQFIKESLTFTGDDSAMNMLLLSMLGAVAEFERSMIHERQAEGIAVAKLKGAYKGRKRKLTAMQVSDLRERLEHSSKSELAAELGVSRQTLYSYLEETKSE